jgi:hypothetical protein
MLALIIAISALICLVVAISVQFSAWTKDEQYDENVLQHAG